MADLRLGVQSLPAAEAGLVRALLKLMGHGRASVAQRWTFAEQGPFDALVTDVSTQNGSLHPARAILRLAQPGVEVDDEDIVARPLRADSLERWLERVSASLAAPRTEDVPTRAAPAGGTPRWKLRRWPPNELLRADPQRMRLATMLSRRALAIDELAQLANVPPEKCRVFVQMLHSFELLAADAPAPAEPTVRATPAPAAAPARWNLVSSIRRKLGLGLGGAG